MSSKEFQMNHPRDHIMANTWRIILEGGIRSSAKMPSAELLEDFSVLEQLLPEYRMIGSSLVNGNDRKRPN